MRWAIAAVLVVAGCGTDPDPRDPTFAVVSQEVLAPSCGQVQCHSTTTRVQGFAFDTIPASRETLLEMGVNPSSPRPRDNELVDVLTADGGSRMPPDFPLTDRDLTLIFNWLDAGAPGL